MKLKRTTLVLAALLPGVALSADFVGIDAPISDQYIVVPALAYVSSHGLDNLAVDLAIEHGIEVKAVLPKGANSVVVRATQAQLQSLMEDQRVRLVKQDGYVRSGDQETLASRLFQTSHPELEKQKVTEYFQQNGISIAAAQDVDVQSADCAVSYRIAEVWNGGFKADVTVTNKRSAPIAVWNMRWDFSGGEKIARAWRSIVVAAGPAVEIGPETYNRSLAPGESVSFGFTAENNPARPGNFRLNGLSCQGSGTPPPPPPPTTPPSGSYGTLVLDESFSNRDTNSWQPYTLAMLTSDFGSLGSRDPRGFDSGKADNRVGNGVLRANYPANRAGGQETGFVFDKFFRAAEEATFEYRVRFEGTGPNNEFVWAYGGKLPGLGGTSLSQSPTGCTTDDNTINNGFSVRLMWLRRGELVAYTYFPDRDQSKCGVNISFLRDAQPNRWYTIRQHIRLNTPGQRNGLLEMHVDGALRLRQTNVYYRASGKGAVKINNILFHTYRGGSATDSRWYSPNSDHIQFDDFKVWVK